MVAMTEPDISALILYLKRRDDLSTDEEMVLRSLPWRVKNWPAASEIVREGQKMQESSLQLSGFTARVGHVASGDRQITGLHIPGDFIDLHSLLLKVMDHSIITLTPCSTASIDHAVLQRLSATHPHLSRMLMMTIAIDAAVQRAWIVDLGRHLASKHMARIFCELFKRLETVGLTAGSSFELPLTQVMFADVLGLSIVHTNRSLQQLRSRGWLEWSDKTAYIHDWASLAEFAGFDPLYLNLQRYHR